MDSRFSTTEGISNKRILRIPDFLNEIRLDNKTYPKGILGSLKETDFDPGRVERIELIAKERKRSYGILKRLFVAFSSESNLLKLAGASSNVIEVHGLRDKQKRTLMESKLVLKRADEGMDETMVSSYRERTPDLLVSPHWLDLMNLSSGDRVIVSNPREVYEIPPPAK